MVARRPGRADGSVVSDDEERGGGWSCRMEMLQVAKA